MKDTNQRQNEFDGSLEHAMQRFDAPSGFTDRVMARLAEGEAAAMPAKVVVMPRRWTATRSWLSGAIAAALVIGIYAGQQQYQRHERTVAAEQQFEAASRITDRALEHTREQLARAGVSLEQ